MVGVEVMEGVVIVVVAVVVEGVGGRGSSISS
jgi:hypothetical protein